MAWHEEADKDGSLIWVRYASGGNLEIFEIDPSVWYSDAEKIRKDTKELVELLAKAEDHRQVVTDAMDAFTQQLKELTKEAKEIKEQEHGEQSAETG